MWSSIQLPAQQPQSVTLGPGTEPVPKGVLVAVPSSVCPICLGLAPLWAAQWLQCVQLPHVPILPGAEESPLESLGPERKLEGQSQQPRSSPMSPWPTPALSLPDSGCGSGGVSAEGGTRCCEINTSVHLEKTYLLQHFFTEKHYE